MIAKRVGTKKASSITRRCVIEEETEELGEKPLCHPPCSNRSIKQSIGIHELARDPQAPTPTRFLETVSCLALRISQYAQLHPPKPGFFQYFPATPKPH